MDIKIPEQNLVLIAGRLTRDPELRYTPKGTALVKLGMAISRTDTCDNGGKEQWDYLREAPPTRNWHQDAGAKRPGKPSAR